EGLFDNVQRGAIEKARGGARVKVRMRGFSIDVLPAVSFTRPQQLDLNIDIAAVNRDARFLELQAVEQTLHTPRDQSVALEMTPSDLMALQGCFRYFHWTRILGLADPSRTPSGDSPQMRLGSEAHKILESGDVPPVDVLESRGLGDLQRVFASEDWQNLAAASVERELPFIMCIRAAGQ